MAKDLDAWFFNLELKQLARIFYWPEGRNAHDFIDDCDEYWRGMSQEEREWFYEKYRS